MTKSTLSALGAISLEDTKLNVKTVSDQAVCGNTAGNIVIDANGELFITQGSEVNCETEERFTAYTPNVISAQRIPMSK